MNMKMLYIFALLIASASGQAAKKIPDSPTPEQIRQMKEEFLLEQKAIKEQPLPNASSAVIPITLSPGEKTQRITLIHGLASVIEFVDVTGSAWPIVRIRKSSDSAVDVFSGSDEVGNNQKNAVDTMPSEHAHIATIIPREQFKSSNIVVFLQGSKVPLIFQLKAREADDQATQLDSITYVIQARGPYAQAIKPSEWSTLNVSYAGTQVLNGQPPSGGASQINSANLPHDITIWKVEDGLWIRTPRELFWPEIIEEQRLHGLRAYFVKGSPSVFTLSGLNDPLRIEQITIDEGL